MYRKTKNNGLCSLGSNARCARIGRIIGDKCNTPTDQMEKKTEAGGRMDVDITVQAKFDEENDAEDMILSGNEDEMEVEVIASQAHPITSNCLSFLIIILACTVLIGEI